MKYYCECISVPLAEKLKEKGMPMEAWQGWATPYISVIENSEYDWLDFAPQMVERRYSIPTFGACFDWFLNKGIHIRIESDWDTETQIVTKLACGFYIEKVGMRPIYVDCPTWHEAAEKAIEKALELIKEK